MKESLSKKRVRLILLILGFIFPVIFGWIISLIGVVGFNIWIILVCTALLMMFITFPKILIYQYKLLKQIFYLANYVFTFIIFSLIFINIIIPISLLMKLFKYDPLRQKRSESFTYKEYIKNKSINLKSIF